MLWQSMDDARSKKQEQIMVHCSLASFRICYASLKYRVRKRAYSDSTVTAGIRQTYPR
jgi:hypothetical protein